MFTLGTIFQSFQKNLIFFQNLVTFFFILHDSLQHCCLVNVLKTLWSPAGKGLTSWLSFVVSSVSLSLSHWYPGSGVVLDCIDS